MNQCVIIPTFITNDFRRNLLNNHIQYFKSKGIDVALAAMEHIAEYKDVDNYITIHYPKWDKSFVSADRYYYFQIGKKRFWLNRPYNINPGNYFIKMYKTTFSYCDNLGYDFVYCFEFDSIFRREYIDKLLDGSLDYSKVYFYKLLPHLTMNAFNGSFCFGNTKKMLEGLTDENLDRVAELVKTGTNYNSEHAMYELYKDHPDLVILTNTEDEVYSDWNMFTTINIADFYYDRVDHKYVFFFSKGNLHPHPFACELLLDDKVIFSKTSTYMGEWQYFDLEMNRQYTLKYYDDHIGPECLHKTKVFYTDPNGNMQINWCDDAS